MDQLDNNELSIETIKKRLFWSSRLLEVCLIVPTLLSYLYYELFSPSLAVPQIITNMFKATFPVFELFYITFDQAEAYRYENAYSFALTISLIGLVAGIKSQKLYHYYDFLHAQRIGGKLLEIRKKQIIRTYKLWAKTFIVTCVFLCPLFASWGALYKTVAPIIWVAMPFAAYQFFIGFFINHYIKRQWRFEK